MRSRSFGTSLPALARMSAPTTPGMTSATIEPTTPKRLSMPVRNSAPSRPPTPPKKIPSSAAACGRICDGRTPSKAAFSAGVSMATSADEPANRRTIPQNHGDSPPRPIRMTATARSKLPSRVTLPGSSRNRASPQRLKVTSDTIDTAAVKAKKRPREPGPRFQRSSKKKNKNVWYGISRRPRTAKPAISRRTVGISISRRTVSKKPSVTSCSVTVTPAMPSP